MTSPALYVLIYKGGSAMHVETMQRMGGYIITTRAQDQISQAWQRRPLRLSGTFFACKRSDSPCSCTGRPGNLVSSSGFPELPPFVLPDEEIPGTVDIASIVLRTLPEFPML